MKSRYCPLCGKKTVRKDIGDEGFIPSCVSCQKALFDSPRPCVIVLAVNEEGQAALISQSDTPDSAFVCVAGYMKPGESAESAAARELLEETGLPAVALRYIGSYPLADRDLLMLGFAGRVKKSPFRLSREVERAVWLSPKDALAQVKPNGAAYALVRSGIQMGNMGELSFIQI